MTLPTSNAITDMLDAIHEMPPKERCDLYIYGDAVPQYVNRGEYVAVPGQGIYPSEELIADIEALGLAVDNEDESIYLHPPVSEGLPDLKFRFLGLMEGEKVGVLFRYVKSEYPD